MSAFRLLSSDLVALRLRGLSFNRLLLLNASLEIAEMWQKARTPSKGSIEVAMGKELGFPRQNYCQETGILGDEYE